jgi:type VI secretion system protein ImpF
MSAFRSAFQQRDSKKEIDIRTDADERIISSRMTTPRNAVSEVKLKQELSDDLSALLNTVNLASAENLDQFDYVRQSVLNYGVNDLTAISVDSRAVENVGDHLKEVLDTYESRLVGGTIAVDKSAKGDEVNTRVSFHVAAEMHASPSDVPVEFVADIESYSGKMNVKRL